MYHPSIRLLRVFIISCCCCLQLHALWPQPRHWSQGSQTILLSSNFTITPSDSLNSFNLPIDLQSALEETLHLIKSDHHQILSNQTQPHINSYQNVSFLHKLEISLTQSKKDWLINSLRAWSWKNVNLRFMNNNQSDQPQPLAFLGIEAEIQKPMEERNESYELSIGPHPTHSHHTIALLSAPTALGLLRGLQTFSQLVYVTSPPTQDQCKPTTESGNSNSQAPLNSPRSAPNTDQSELPQGVQQPLTPVLRYLYGPLEIKDAPAFPYRGLLLDTSRNFYPISDLKRTIDAMSWAKLSTFHWHITDAQSWPLQLPHHPELSQSGAYSNAEVYSIEEIQELTKYANSKGVEVMIEIDTPGHTSIMGEAHPDLIACKDAQPWSQYAAEPPAGQLRVADERALSLVQAIYTFMGEQIPGSLFSSGGDEVNHKCYDDDGPTQSLLASRNSSLNEMLSHFVRKSHESIRQTGKTPVVWEELVLMEHLPLEFDTIVAVWRSSNNVREVVEKGYRVIHAASDFAYLDCGLGGWLGKSAEGNSWCDPFKTWQKIYSFDPYANITRAQRKLITGGQVSLWSEQADPQNLDSLVWPRALAAAEVYWTGRGANGDEVEPLDQRLAEALPRLHDMRYRFVQRGIRASALQPHWCALRPGQCDLS